MKRTLTFTYCFSGDPETMELRKISKEFDIEDYALNDDEIQSIEESMYDMVDPPDGQSVDYEDLAWDSYPAPKGSGENPPEGAWIEIEGRRWATDGTMLIAEDQPIRIPAINRWHDISEFKSLQGITQSIAGYLKASETAKIPHPGFFDISFKPFQSSNYKILSIDGGPLSTGYVFETSSDRLVAAIMPVQIREAVPEFPYQYLQFNGATS